jgi:predicted transposase YbfD/YdcC
LIGVKNNVKAIKRRMVKLFEESIDDEFLHKEQKVIHGRKESRRTSIRLTNPEGVGLPHAHSIIRVIRERTEIRKGKVINTSTETAYYVSSLKEVKAEKANKLVRDHWSVENRLHYIKDVSQLEDQCILNNGLARILAAVRSLAVVILRRLKGTLPVIQRKIASKPSLAIDFLTCKHLSRSQLQSLK